MNKEFEGKYAVVTGGAGGISYEAAKTLALKVPRFLLKKVYQELSLPI